MSNSMPVLFVGHGSPMNALEDNIFSRTWTQVGRQLPRPKAIVSVSAHWQTAGTRVTAMKEPNILYDFYGFPQPLYEMHYPAPGAPDLARQIRQTITDPEILLDFSWGLDHGTWSVLGRLFPAADIPVMQLSLDFDQPAAFHYQLGRQLKYLRGEGILVLGSGNMVHNLGMMKWEEGAFDWAQRFDAAMADRITSGDHRSLIDYHSLGPDASLAIPTNEHYLPLLYVLAMQEPYDKLTFFCDQVTLGSISMRSLLIA
jgi:4,5-DOPA dioxygenase extradiol